MSDFKWPTAYIPCDSYSAAHTYPIPETRKQSLPDRLNKSVIGLELEYGQTTFTKDVKEAATAIRELVSGTQKLIAYCENHNWGNIPEPRDSIQPILDALTKYQETK